MGWPKPWRWPGKIGTAIEVIGHLRTLKGAVNKMDRPSWKKLTAAVVGAVIVAAGSALGIPEDTINWLAGIVVAYILGQGIADAGKEAAKITNGR